MESIGALSPLSEAPSARSKIEAKLVTAFRTRLELLTCLAKYKTGPHELVQPSADALKQLAAHLAGVTAMSDTCAIELLNMLDKSNLAPDDRIRALDLVNAKVLDTEPLDSEASKNDAKQMCPYFTEYLQNEDPDAAMAVSPQSSMTTRFKALARVARKIGLNHATEGTKAGIMAAAFFDRPNHILHELAGPKGYHCLKAFKAYLKVATVQVVGRTPLLFPPFKDLSLIHI